MIPFFSNCLNKYKNQNKLAAIWVINFLILKKIKYFKTKTFEAFYSLGWLPGVKIG